MAPLRLLPARFTNVSACKLLHEPGTVPDSLFDAKLTDLHDDRDSTRVNIRCFHALKKKRSSTYTSFESAETTTGTLPVSAFDDTSRDVRLHSSDNVPGREPDIEFEPKLSSLWQGQQGGHMLTFERLHRYLDQPRMPANGLKVSGTLRTRGQIGSREKVAECPPAWSC